MVWSDVRLGEIPWEKVSASLHWAEGTKAPSQAQAGWMSRHSHHHGYGEIVVCLKGPHAYGLGGRIALLGPGSALFIPGQVAHDATYSRHHLACVDLWLHFLPGGLAAMKLVDHNPTRPLRLLPIPCPQGTLLNDFRRACALAEAAPVGRKISERKTAGFLTYILQAVFEKLAEGGYRTASDQEAALVESIKAYACRHLADRLTLEELARVAGYSPFHFHRVFLRIEGVTPRKFVLAKRLEAACRLLEEGRSVTSTAMDTGFTDPSQFAKVFKQHFKTTPRCWRESEGR